MGKFTDILFNRSIEQIYPINVFRTVPGRFAPIIENAQPVRVVNHDAYGMSQSTVTLVLANTEYMIRGIATMSAIVLKARGGAVQFSIYEGQSNSVYTLLADGQAFEMSVIPFGQIEKPISFFARSTVAGAVVELLGMRLL
jgi:hypothetical protein